MIRKVQKRDAARLAEIYNYYISNTTITFETKEIDAQEMENRISSLSATGPYLVYEEDGIIKGYCYAHPWKVRKAYANTYEVTIYLDNKFKGEGLGKKMVTRLIEECKSSGLHALIACITAENSDSCIFHEKLGFNKVSHFKEVGWKFDRWIDVCDYELILSEVK